MRIKGTYKIREIAGESLIVEQGKSQADMTKIISLNESALFLWNKLQGSDFSMEEAAQVLINQYGISKEEALSDVKKWADKLSECGIIE